MANEIKDWKVLVVEDEPDSMEAVQDILGYYGIETVGAHSAEDALKIIESFTPSLAILDLALPKMDGWRLQREIRARASTASIPIVAVTAFHSTKVAQEAIEAGFNAYFSKPIDATSFVRELERVAEG